MKQNAAIGNDLVDEPQRLQTLELTNWFTIIKFGITKEKALFANKVFFEEKGGF